MAGGMRRVSRAMHKRGGATSPRHSKARTPARSVVGAAAELWQTRELTVDMLGDAAQRGSLSEVRAALESGISIDARAEDGKRALHRAAVGGSRLVIETLVKTYGATVDAQDDDSSTPLHIAARDNQSDAIRAFLELGARPEAQNVAGNTPLHCAAANGGIRAIKALVRAGVSVEPRNKAGWTPLFIAAYNVQLAAVRKLAELGASVNTASSGGDTPMHRLASLGHTEGIRLLFHLGADATRRNKRGETAFYAAVSADQPAAAAICEAAIHAANEAARERRMRAALSASPAPMGVLPSPSGTSVAESPTSTERSRFQSLLFSEEADATHAHARFSLQQLRRQRRAKPHPALVRPVLSRAQLWALSSTREEMDIGLLELHERRRQQRRKQRREARRQHQEREREREAGAASPSRAGAARAVATGAAKARGESVEKLPAVLSPSQRSAS